MRASQRQRLATRRSEPTPPDTGLTAPALAVVTYWRGRAVGAEAALDSVLTADSVAFDSLAGLSGSEATSSEQSGAPDDGEEAEVAGPPPPKRPREAPKIDLEMLQQHGYVGGPSVLFVPSGPAEPQSWEW